MPDPIPQEYQVYDPTRHEIRVVVIEPPKHRYWLHALLLLATIFTTLCIGARMQYGFEHNIGLFSQDADIWPWLWILEDWHRLGLGVAYSACVLGILGAHELGHYVYCVLRRVFATLPFFIPAPTLIGTLGAFIRIKSPLRSRADLFDIGIAGPIAGFVVAVPVLIFGLLASKPLTGQALANTSPETSLVLGFPLIFKLAHWALGAAGVHSAAVQAPLASLYLHPAAVGAWIGMLATALNLLPGGQLDGGHIIFAVNPRLHRPISFISIVVLLALSWYYWEGWLLWAVVLRFTGSRHPDVPIAPPLNRTRRVLAIFALIMLVLTLAPAPFVGPNNGLSQYFKHKADQQQQNIAPSKQR
ncbi:MAG TPA: site-2 protease family protein [Candidatus Angelobacter sp.]|nr:site-2 protease family protein [Candidatus Angelobacter sp.]